MHVSINYFDSYYYGALNTMNEGYTPLHEFAKQGDLASIRLIASPDNINLKDSRGHTPIHYALMFNKIEAYNLLISLGAEQNEAAYDNLSHTYAMEDITINSGHDICLGCIYSFFCSYFFPWPE